MNPFRRSEGATVWRSLPEDPIRPARWRITGSVLRIKTDDGDSGAEVTCATPEDAYEFIAVYLAEVARWKETS